MANLGDLVKKAVYLGVGIATYAAEKAEVNLQEWWQVMNLIFPMNPDG